MYRRLLLTALVLFAIFVGIVALQPSHFRVQREIAIAAPTLAVFDRVNDFRAWPAWSPWTELDHSARITVEGAAMGEGAVFKWSGNDSIGAGVMEIVESRSGSFIRITSRFTRPIMGASTSEFAFKRESDLTHVTWSVAGHHSFLAKALALFVGPDRVLGPQMEKGLATLRLNSEASAPKEQ